MLAMALTTDTFFERIGSFGRFQIALNLFFNLCSLFWWAVPVTIMVFIASEPNWKCVNNSTCPFTDSISIIDERYNHRCNILRKDWRFEDDFTSVVTEVCAKRDQIREQSLVLIPITLWQYILHCKIPSDNKCVKIIHVNHIYKPLSLLLFWKKFKVVSLSLIRFKG